jgi:peptide/nickel transport system permease protein
VRGRYLVRRLLQALPTLAGIVLLSFVLIQAAPGDPILALAGDSGDASYYAEMRDHFALDEPWPVQLAAYVKRLGTGDLGISRVQGRPVRTVVGERIGATLLLTGTAWFLSTVLGILLGVVTALRRGRVLDLATDAFMLGFYAAPVFWVGQLAVVILSVRLGLFPVFGMRDVGEEVGWSLAALDTLRHLSLPALVLASHQLAGVTRVTRTTLVRELRKGYVLAARARGLPTHIVVRRHALRLALLPTVTVVGHRIGYLLGGAVIVETIFGWPGLGTLLMAALQSRDRPVVLGIFLLVAVAVVVANLLTDLVYAWLDPRIKYE